MGSQILTATENALPFFLFGERDGRLSAGPRKTGIVHSLGLRDTARTQLNYNGLRELKSRQAALTSGDKFEELIRSYENGDNFGFEIQIRPVIEGGLPLILYSVNSKGEIIEKPYAEQDVAVITLGENPNKPGNPFHVSYSGPQRLVTYEEALNEGFPFLDRVREKTSQLKNDSYRRFIENKKARLRRAA